MNEAATIELDCSRWFNTAEPLRLAALRGRVVVLHVFQMLCPACVAHGTPQAARLHARLDPQQAVVIGLHSVFEHHAVTGADALAAYIHENRLRFPIGVDRHDDPHGIPQTMATLELQGTPSLLLFDRDGRLRLKHFGTADDLEVGLAVGRLVGAG